MRREKQLLAATMERLPPDLQRAPDSDSGKTKLAQLYQLLSWWRWAVVFLGFIIVAGRFWPASQENNWEIECLRKNGNVSDMATRLLYQRLTSELEETREENHRLKSREEELQQMYEDEVQKGHERVKDLQSYRESEVERKEREKQDLVTLSKSLKSQLDDKENEIDNLISQQMELQQKYDIEGRKRTKDLQSCQADVKSKSENIEDLNNRIHVSQEEHDKRLQAEQQHKEDELKKRDKRIRDLKLQVQEKEQRIQTLTGEVDTEKKKLQSEKAQCDRKLEDLRSTQNDGSLWVSGKFAAGFFMAFGVMLCIGCIAGATERKR